MLSIRHINILSQLCSSLVTTLRAAEMFEKSWLETPEVAKLIDGAKAYYVEGFFLTHGIEAALEIAKKASEMGKVHAVDPLMLLL